MNFKTTSQINKMSLDNLDKLLDSFDKNKRIKFTIQKVVSDNDNYNFVINSKDKSELPSFKITILKSSKTFD